MHYKNEFNSILVDEVCFISCACVNKYSTHYKFTLLYITQAKLRLLWCSCAKFRHMREFSNGIVIGSGVACGITGWTRLTLAPPLWN